jgi:hypothetical protein
LPSPAKGRIRPEWVGVQGRSGRPGRGAPRLA